MAESIDPQSESPSDAPNQSLPNYHDLYLRALADFQNFQKRMRLETDRVKEETIRKFLLDLLPIWDSLELILHYSTESVSNNLIAQFHQFLSQQGIALVEVMPGDKFDSAIHEAITFEEKEGVTEFIVAEVLRNGFSLNNKIIRPTQVKLFKPIILAK